MGKAPQKLAREVEEDSKEGVGFPDPLGGVCQPPPHQLAGANHTGDKQCLPCPGEGAAQLTFSPRLPFSPYTANGGERGCYWCAGA